MTGAITWEAISWGLGAIIAIGTMIGWGLKLLSLRDKRIDELSRDLQDHKLHAANHYATKDGLTVALAAMQSSIDRLVERVDGLLDNIILQNKNKQ